MWDEPAEGLFHGTPENDRQTYGSQTEGDSGRAAKADARGNRRNIEVVADGGEGVFPIPCGAGQRGATESVSARGEANLATDAMATKSANPLDVEAIHGATRQPTTRSRDPTSVSERALRRQTSKTGTVCVSRASTGLSGGQRVTAV